MPSLIRLFERGSRESNLPRVGVGLAVCRAIVEAHGGRIVVANRKGGVARVRFDLPVTPMRPLPSEETTP